MAKTTPTQNKALVLEAFDLLFNKRDYAAAERYWSDRYVQHSAHIAPGRDGLFNLVRTLPNSLKYENQLIVAEGDYVIAHGRFSGHGRPAAWIAADIVRFEDGKLVEHWDVLQDEATKAQSTSGLPMFGDRFPADMSALIIAPKETSHDALRSASLRQTLLPTENWVVQQAGVNWRSALLALWNRLRGCSNDRRRGKSNHSAVVSAV